MELEMGSRTLETDKIIQRSRCLGTRMIWFAAFTSLLQGFTVGLAIGFSAPATYDMQTRNDSVIKPTQREIMWIGSLMSLGQFPGGILAGFLADKIGRKNTLVYNIVPYAFGWLTIFYAETVPVLLLGRLVVGLAIGIICVVAPMYCVEIATDNTRGNLGSAFQGFLVTGNLLSVIIGAYIPWKYLSLNAAVWSVLSIMVLCFAPESPRWLLMKNKFELAVNVMDELHGQSLNARGECEIIYKELQNQPKGRVTWKEYMHPTSLKPGIISFLIMFFKQFSGINALFVYSSSIFEVSKDFLDPKISTIILGAVQVVLTLLSNITVDKVGRKILLTISGGLMSISFAIFGVYYHKVSTDPTADYNYNWIPLVCCVAAVIGYSVGYGPISFLLSAELLPVRTRSTVSAAAHIVNGICIFLITSTFSDLVGLLNNYGAFWFYSTMSAIGVMFIILFVPETKGKKLEEIQDMFYKKPLEQDIPLESCGQKKPTVENVTLLSYHVYHIF